MEHVELFFPTIADGEDKTCPLKNCMRNNYRHLRKWAKRTGTNAFRLYDRHIREYPLACDFYDGRFCVHYFSKFRDDDDVPEDLYHTTEKALCDLFQVGKERIFWRTRKRREKLEQYEKVAGEKEFFTVYEYGVPFLVNLTDYLDTGLFLDHREIRQLVAKTCQGKSLLNLFAYTCSFSVHAAKHGARFTKSVDMSNTYTDWGRKNFLLNQLSLQNNVVIREDVFRFLEEEGRTKTRYDVIVVDPPTISRSKKMSEMFDIQKDYIGLLKKALHLLENEGVLFFSTNSRKFDFDESSFSGVKIEEVTQKTHPPDFHDQKIHRAWRITKL